MTGRAHAQLRLNRFIQPPYRNARHIAMISMRSNPQKGTSLLYWPQERNIPCNLAIPTSPPFERSSRRRKGFPSETNVKRASRTVHGEKDLIEKLGRNDPCPCGSGRRFQKLLSGRWNLRRRTQKLLFSGGSSTRAARLPPSANALPANLFTSPSRFCQHYV